MLQFGRLLFLTRMIRAGATSCPFSRCYRTIVTMLQHRCRVAASVLARRIVPRGLVTANSPKPIKRFYENATVLQAGSVWRISLDGKPVKTPKGSFLELPTEAVAEGVAQEWRQQGERLKTKEMPLTTIGCTVLDLVKPDPGSCVERLLPYLATDTICFLDDHEPLAERQQLEWAPLRSWFEDSFNVGLGVATGISTPNHPEATMLSIEDRLKQRDMWELCALEIATGTAKSLIVASALMDKSDMSAEEALRLALLEEHFQIERWGLVEGEHDVSHSDALMWLAACQRFSVGRRGLRAI